MQLTEGRFHRSRQACRSLADPDFPAHNLIGIVNSNMTDLGEIFEVSQPQLSRIRADRVS